MVQGSSYERQFKKILEDNDFHVIRSAGSLDVDLVAIKKLKEQIVVCLFEVKSFKGKKYYPTKNEKTKEQWRLMKNLETFYWLPAAPMQTIVVAYALHRKGARGEESWIIASPLTLDAPEYHVPLEKFLDDLGN